MKRFFFAVLLFSLVFASPAVAFRSPAEEYTNHLNYSRWASGLWGVCTDGVLAKSAQAQAEKMAVSGRLSHSTDLLAAAPRGASLVAENVGVGGDLAKLHAAFLQSPSHAANILNNRLTHIGVGSVKKDGRVWVAVILMSYPGRACGLWS